MKTIKQRISYAVMGLMAMGFTACTQNEDMTPTLKGQEINATFSVGGMQTRVNTLGHGDNWENDDLISVLQIYGDESTRTGKYQYIEENGQARWNSVKTIRWEREERCELIAWYPSDITNPFIYNLHPDQSDEDLLKKADLINGYWYDVPIDYVDIPMKHRMSMVTIVYHVGTADYPNMDISEPQVYSKNTSVNFNRDQDQWQFVMSTPSGNSAWVQACKHDGDMFSAIVIPGSYKTGEIFLKFKIGDKNFHAKMKSDTDFKEGERNTYKLDVGKDKVELTRISVNDMTGWTNEEELK
ncbi:fimbrillin family protein [Bacteroides xylanisolvens]|uniref:Fimbrillin family protein n=1 Tax=Bacteroides xylanisolvens TaxID=371601 RepID=A0AAW4T512_9BACE|nr:fimbrillin family protein [Bacteroides xylanisolvens]MCA4633552.1 fimbrillin family protein [Bacteroides xylanisolvens]MCA4638537.1 fimbrillin family protein [Bacteroides xylanisolvens]MCA4657910.1 fimbrillin family protein [Bacteroides xylanisolvens]MCA4677455.1 fimbrillin family protein [Bacteroides xylanisolvens]MCA4680213.1 fimbrillin family protein [Bacteroides xylanisolvens]